MIRWCVHCGLDIVLADDGQTWLHRHPYAPYRHCAITSAEPASVRVGAP